jgi:membrane associated rhomboid family serine protease
MWQRRILTWTLPIGVLLLALWVLWIAFGLVNGIVGTEISWVSAAMGLLSSLILIAAGALFRHELARR